MTKLRIFPEVELRKRRENQDVFRIITHMRGVKKRCRKADRHCETLGFIERKGEGQPDFEIVQAVKEEAKKFAGAYMKTLNGQTIEIQPASYEAPVGDSSFSGIRQNIFDPNTVRATVL